MPPFAPAPPPNAVRAARAASMQVQLPPFAPAPPPRLGARRAPDLFAVLQLLGAELHRAILQEQEAAASVVLSEPEWGPQLRQLKHGEVTEKMTQALASNLSPRLAAMSAADGHRAIVDRDLIPAMLCGVATGVRDRFQDALLRAAPGARIVAKCAEPEHTSGHRWAHTKRATELREVAAVAAHPPVELKVGPIKRANRIGVKISEYEKEKGAGDFPFSQFVTDVLRASYVACLACH